jgi:hypothetical protein
LGAVGRNYAQTEHQLDRRDGEELAAEVENQVVNYRDCTNYLVAPVRASFLKEIHFIFQALAPIISCHNSSAISALEIDFFRSFCQCCKKLIITE